MNMRALQLKAEESMLRQLLKDANWSAAKAAEEAKVPQSSFRYMLRRHEKLYIEWLKRRPINRFG